MTCPCGDPNCSGPLDHLRTAEIIATSGWQSVAVEGGHGRPTMVYTIGLTERGLPEIVTFGLPPRAAHGFFCEIMGRLDEVRHGAVLRGLARGDWRTAFVSLPAEQACQDHLIQARAYYGRDVDVIQMVWPDKSGTLPWEPGFDHSLAWMQDQVVPLSSLEVTASPDPSDVPGPTSIH